MEELKEIYAGLEKEIEEKYHDAIVKICEKYGCDLGVGLDKLKAIARGNKEYGEGLELELDGFVELYAKQLYVSEQIARAAGNL